MCQIQTSRRRSGTAAEPFPQLLSNAVPGRSEAVRRRKAIATMAKLIGALILARAVDDPALSEEILAAGLRALMPAMAAIILSGAVIGGPVGALHS
jgi:hypothetical protein